MPENQQPPVRKRNPITMFLSFLLLVSAIALIAFSCSGGFNQDTHLSANELLTYALNNRIQSVSETTVYDYDMYKLSGTYYPQNKTSSNPAARKYYLYISKTEYYEPSTSWYYKDFESGANINLPETSIYDQLKAAQNRLIEDSTLIPGNRDSDYFRNNFFYSTPMTQSWWESWGPTLLTLAGSIIICFFLFSRLTGSIAGSNNKALEFNKSRARRAVSKVKFDDVAGANEEKQEMKELVDYLKEPKKFTKYGAKLPKGVLLVGPPGCGKTLLAKAVAGEAGVPFFSISGSDFVEMFVGVGAGRVRDMFRVAKENAPCLIFIDEIDAVGRQRGAGLGGGNDEREQTLNQLLVEMDGFTDNSGIIVIAATNRDDVLDPALLRAGRFDRKITVTLPDREGREAIFKVHSKNKKVAPDVNFDALARRTVGFSGADIENIMNEAAILAIRKNKEAIDIDDIDEAIDRRIAGPAKSSRALNEHERKIVAYHEAGHAIIGLKLEHSDKVQKITIIPRGNTGGHVRMTPEEDRFLLTKKELEARIVGYLGGRSSEEIFFNDVSTGASNDIEMATQIARSMVTELGMSALGPIQYERDTGSVFLGRDYTNSQKNFSVETATKIDAEVRKIIDESHELAKKIILDNKDSVILIAKTLLKHEQITAEEIDYLLANGHLKRDEKPAPEASEEKPVSENKGE